MTDAAAKLGVMGKHPAFGDFVQAGVLQNVDLGLTAWIDQTLSALRADMQDGWADFWAQAQMLRFWIGRDVLDDGVIGVFRPWHDKVGRQYPLIVMAQGPQIPFPGDQGAIDQTPWEQIEAHLANLAPQGGGGASLLQGLDLALPAQGDGERSQGATLWAHHPSGNLEALLRSAGRADPARAALGRSYWWTPGDYTRTAIWLGCNGLPSAASLGWLLAGTQKTGEPDGE